MASSPTQPQQPPESAQIVLGFDIGIKNLAVCALSVSHSEVKILIWKIIALAAPKEKTPILNEISGRIFLELDSLVDDLNMISDNAIDYVILENQPSNLNGTMKTIQMIIYFLLKTNKYFM